MRLTATKDLAALRTAALAGIDAAAERARGAWITLGSAQAMVYQAKAAEAARYLAIAEPPADLAGYPLLAAEVGITATTAQELAMLWLNMADRWSIAAAAIEATRIAAKRAVGAATSPAAIEAAADVAWPTPEVV